MPAGAGPDIRTLRLDDGREVIHVVQPVLNGRGGYVHIGMDTAPIHQAMTRAIWRQLGLTFIAFGLCVTLAFLFIRGVTGRLDSLARYARRVAAHDFSATCEVRSDDEIGVLAGSMAGLGWWVLAQGRLLDPVDFAAREAAREDLLEAVRKAGALVPENIWVWDETGRAQLVLATLPTLERASRVAERLRQKGLNIAVRREMPRQD